MPRIKVRPFLPEVFAERGAFAQVTAPWRARCAAPTFMGLMLIALFALAFPSVTAQEATQTPETLRRYETEPKSSTPSPSPGNAEDTLKRIDERLSNLEKLAANPPDRLSRWGNLASIIGVILSIGLGLAAGFYAWFIHWRQSAEARKALIETTSRIEGALTRLEALRSETQFGITNVLESISETLYELENIATHDEAIDQVKEWFSKPDDLLTFEFFSPFSEVPLFWQDQNKAGEIIGTLSELKDQDVEISLIGPDGCEFNKLCAEVVQRIIAESTQLPPRFAVWLREAKNASSQHSKGETSHSEATETTGMSERASDNNSDGALRNALLERIQTQYQGLAKTLELNQVKIDNHSEVAKLRIGYAYARFSTSRSLRRHDNYHMIVFSNEAEDEGSHKPSAGRNDRVSRLLAKPVIFITRNPLIMSGLRSAVHALIEQRDLDVIEVS